MRKKMTLMVFLLSLVFSGLSLAQDAANVAPPPNAAQALFQKSLEQVGGLQALSVQSVEKMKLVQAGQAQDMSLNILVTLKGKDLMYAEQSNEQFKVVMVRDGKKSTLYDERQKVYFEPPMMTPRVRLLTAAMDPIMGMSVTWLSRYLHGDLKLLAETEEFVDGGEEKISVGEEKDIAARKISLKTKRANIEVWLAGGETPLLRQFRMDASPFVAQMSGQQDIQLVYENQLSAWQINPELADTQFAFTPPADATKKSLQEQPEYMDQAAPALNLDLLDGGKLDLASHKGKDVVLIDFWATWCGPCRSTMPVLNQTAKDYADKGVKVYAINSGETPEQIKPFMEKMALSLPVALDPSKEAGKAYGVSGIPFMVMIDKEGVVRAVHQGASPTLKEDLAQEIEILLNLPAAAAPAGQ